jgi:hypothetical protein
MTPEHKGFLSAYVRDPGALQQNSEDSGARALRGGKTDLEQRSLAGRHTLEHGQERPTADDEEAGSLEAAPSDRLPDPPWPLPPRKMRRTTAQLSYDSRPPPLFSETGEMHPGVLSPRAYGFNQEDDIRRIKKDEIAFRKRQRGDVGRINEAEAARRARSRRENASPLGQWSKTPQVDIENPEALMDAAQTYKDSSWWNLLSRLLQRNE